MTSKPESSEDDDDGKGCLFIIGLVIVGIALGNIYSAAAGWLIIGVGLVIVALL